MDVTSISPIQIDLYLFKLHLNMPDVEALSLHFDTPSRRFDLSLIALMAKKMKGGGCSLTIDDAGTLAEQLRGD